jgi:type II secretory pathway pseudopilin PulG
LTRGEAAQHNKKYMQKGQALVVVLLILGVIATVGLSVASRSVTEVRVSTTQEESARALEAAEIGLEKYLGGVSLPAPGTKVNVPDINAGYYIPSVDDIGGSNNFYKVPYELVAGDIATVDMPACSPVDGQNCTHLKVCWGESATSPKIEISFYYLLRDAANQGRVAVRRIGFDPNSTSPYPGFVFGNSHVHANYNCGSGAMKWGTQISLSGDAFGDIDLNLAVNKLLLVRVRMLGNGSDSEPVSMQIAGNGIFPLQGGEVTAIGEAGESIQKVKATVVLWDLPPMFDSAVFSGKSIISPI